MASNGPARSWAASSAAARRWARSARLWACCSATSSTSTPRPGQPRADSGENLTAIGERFFRATFRVMGYLAKADGRVSEAEIAAARGVMSDLRLNPRRCARPSSTSPPASSQASILPPSWPRSARACQGRPDLAARLPRNPGPRRTRRQQHGGPGARPHGPRRRTASEVSAFELAQIEAVLRIRQRRLPPGHAQAPGAARGGRGPGAGVQGAGDQFRGEQRGSRQGVPPRS